MKTTRIIHAVDSHTEGMPTRVVTGGVGTIPGATMAERRQYFIDHLDDLRTFLMCEPRGHASMSGTILQPPTRPDADYGVLFIEVSGLLPMCGHGTIGTATVLVETGMVPVQEPVTTIRLDTPAGLVVAEVQIEDGHAKAVTIQNVPSFSYALDQTVTVPGFGEVTYDIAFGGGTSMPSWNWQTSVLPLTEQIRTPCSTPDCRSWKPSTSRTVQCTRFGKISTVAIMSI